MSDDATLKFIENFLKNGPKEITPEIAEKRRLRALEERDRSFDSFQFEGFVSEETIKKYEDKLPQDMIDLWADYGYGQTLHGFLKVINPDEYQHLWTESVLFHKEAIPLFVTGFGDIIAYDGAFFRIMRLRYNDFTTLSSARENLQSFYRDLDTRYSKFKFSIFGEAYKTYGPLRYEECYGFFPILPTGGSETVEHIQIVKIKEHIALHRSLLEEADYADK